MVYGNKKSPSPHSESDVAHHVKERIEIPDRPIFWLH
jgi:hypothetical protein